MRPALDVMALRWISTKNFSILYKSTRSIASGPVAPEAGSQQENVGSFSSTVGSIPSGNTIRFSPLTSLTEATLASVPGVT